MQFMQLIEGWGLEYLITQDPLSKMLIDEFGKIVENQEFKTWRRFKTIKRIKTIYGRVDSYKEDVMTALT